MSKGQLPVEIMAVYKENPSPHTVKELQDALTEAHPEGKPRSGGAIGYALDRLILEKIVERVGTERPARYQPTGNDLPTAAVPVPTPRTPRTRTRTDVQATVERAAETAATPRGAVIGKGPCGFCSETKDVRYHLAHCPRTIKRGAGELDWKCPCCENHHSKAIDFEIFALEVQIALDVGAGPEEIEDLLRGIISEIDIKGHAETKEPEPQIEVTEAEVVLEEALVETELVEE
jgi:hypothetical protein